MRTITFIMVHVETIVCFRMVRLLWCKLTLRNMHAISVVLLVLRHCTVCKHVIKAVLRKWNEQVDCTVTDMRYDGPAVYNERYYDLCCNYKHQFQFCISAFQLHVLIRIIHALQLVKRNTCILQFNLLLNRTDWLLVNFETKLWRVICQLQIKNRVTFRVYNYLEVINLYKTTIKSYHLTEVCRQLKIPAIVQLTIFRIYRIIV